MPADHYIIDSDMKKVADAIRSKGGTTAPLVFPDGFVQAINDIQTGGGGDTPRTWTENDFIKTSGSQYLTFIYNIKDTVRQFFIVGDTLNIAIDPCDAGYTSWGSSPIPGISFVSNGSLKLRITGTITGGTELTDVFNVFDDDYGSDFTFRTADGKPIPIK